MCGVRTKTDCRSRVVRKSIKSACVSRGHMRPRILSHLVLNGGLYTFRPSNFRFVTSTHVIVVRRHNVSGCTCSLSDALYGWYCTVTQRGQKRSNHASHGQSGHPMSHVINTIL